MSGARGRTGVLLINLGTPASPSVADVRRYLREFLSDPRVIDLPPLGRWMLLNLVILPFRPKRSAEAYSKVWLADGSPLLVYEERLARAAGGLLGERFVVELGMRYGSPSIASALARLAKAAVERIVVLPLFPQYASASTGSALERVFDVVGASWTVPDIVTIGAFYDHPKFIEPFARIAKPILEAFRPDHVLFSYHGLPERHVTKCDATGRHCLVADECCATIVEANRHCYRAQCYATTRALAGALGLVPALHSVSFQSRLGRTPWIKPYTDWVLPELSNKGVKRLAVMCPAFVADCLETLEEIGIRAKEDWRRLGGEDLLLVPSLNAEPIWVEAVADLIRNAAGS